MPLRGVLRFDLNLGHLIGADAFDGGESPLGVVTFAELLLDRLKLPLLDVVEDRSIFVDQISQVLASLIQAGVSALKNDGSGLGWRKVMPSWGSFHLFHRRLIEDIPALLRPQPCLRVTLACPDHITSHMRVITHPALRSPSLLPQPTFGPCGLRALQIPHAIVTDEESTIDLIYLPHGIKRWPLVC
jgi:hypothetical protein